MKMNSNNQQRILVIGLVIAPLMVLVIAQYNLISAQDFDNRQRRSTYRQRESQLREGNQQPGNFKSGAQRSEIILREISATLKTIDQRLERLEKMAESMPDRTPSLPSPIRGR